MKNLSILFLLGLFIFAGTSMKANPVTTSTMDMVKDTTNYPVPITIQLKVLKKTPKGVLAEVTAIRMGKKANLEKHQISGTMQLQVGQVAIRLDNSDIPVNRIRIPARLKLPENLSKELGASKSVVMSGGTTMLQKEGSGLLQFEIQD